MPRIQDIGAFSAVREAGLAKLASSRSPRRHRDGDLRPRQWRRGLQHAFAEAIEHSGMDVLLDQRWLFRRLFRRAAGQCATARQAAC